MIYGNSNFKSMIFTLSIHSIPHSKCCEILRDFACHFESHHTLLERLCDIMRNKKEDISNFVINAVSADAVVPLGARRAGQDQGGPRWDTLTKKSKSTKLLHIVMCYTQGVVAYDPVLFGGCIPPTLTPLKVKPEALILVSIGGRALQCGLMYIFNVFVLPFQSFICFFHSNPFKVKVPEQFINR